MIEILKHGNTKMKVECGMCHCVFTYTKNDIFETRYKDLTPAIICPECSYNIDPIFSEEIGDV